MTRRDVLLSSVAPWLAPARPKPICIFLRGGNDGHNTVVRLADYDAYRRARGELALSEKSLVRVGDYGFHPALAPLCGFPISIVANVGLQTRNRPHGDVYRDWMQAIGDRPVINAAWGFDTHGAQLELQSKALAMFARCACELVKNGATIFTASEFGRTLAPNSSAGSDHGWGNHHLVIGAEAGRIYGNFPAMDRDVMDPTLSVEKYCAIVDQFVRAKAQS